MVRKHMGTYIAQADLDIPSDILQRLTDDAGAGAVDATKVTEVIADAEAEFDGYVGTRYQVPLTTGLSVAKRCCKVIAKYILYNRRNMVPETLQKEYDNIVRFLRDVAKGMVSLGVDPAPVKESSQGLEVASETRIFSRTKLEGM